MENTPVPRWVGLNFHLPCLDVRAIFGMSTEIQPMETAYLYYTSGEEVHAGDRVQHKGSYATVVFVSTGDSEEYSPGYEDYTGSERGVLLCDDDGATTFVGEPDEMLEFLDRG